MFGISPVQVIKQAPPLANQFQQTPPRVIVFSVCLEMLGKTVDSVSQQRNLHFRRAGIRWMLFIFAYYIPLRFLS